MDHTHKPAGRQLALFATPFIIILSLTAASFAAAFGRDEGTLGNGALANPTTRCLRAFSLTHAWAVLEVFDWPRGDTRKAYFDISKFFAKGS